MRYAIQYRPDQDEVWPWAVVDTARANVVLYREFSRKQAEQVVADLRRNTALVVDRPVQYRGSIRQCHGDGVVSAIYRHPTTGEWRYQIEVGEERLDLVRRESLVTL